MAREVAVSAPVRIDLAGGWTDVPVYCSNHPGLVVNIAINHFITASCVIDDERKVEVSYRSELPTGCGLGTSGAMNVAFVAAVSPETEPLEQIAEKAYQIEAVLGNTGGRQDQWASAYGGVQRLSFGADTVVRTRLTPSDEFTHWLEQHLLLFDTHIPHVSGELHRSVWSRFNSGDNEVIEGLATLRRAAESMVKSIENEDKKGLGSALKTVMAGVDLLDHRLHDPFRFVLEPLEKSGLVVAWKAMGAGGGGVVGVLVSQDKEAEGLVNQAAGEAGWTPLLWKVEPKGVQRNYSFNHG